MHRLTFLLGVLALIVACQAKGDIPPLTVSGISSGAYMAVQFHIAHSSIVGGAGVVAGGPYWCAQDDAAVALSACMRDPSLISLNELWAATDYAEALASIDSTKHLMGSRVLLFSGQEDTVVAPGVMQKLEGYYAHYLDARDMLPLFNFSCVHGMVTLDYGLPCGTFGSPFLNNCSYDLAGAILQQVYGGDLRAPAAPAADANLVSVAQAQYVPAHDPSLLTSLGPLAYVYYPSGCSRAPSNCSRVHVAFHGCEQTIGDVQLQFVQHAGYNAWAEANDIVVLYPQVQRDDAVNPEGCWDWWGYTGADYATKLGIQIATVLNMVQAV